LFCKFAGLHNQTAALALGFGGLAPVAVPPTIGLVRQASNLGQFVGPVAHPAAEGI
jgi:hypothetical protein